MTNRLLKQLTILLIFLFICFLIALAVYYLIHSAPSCSDGIQNQEEEGIDCGGPCPPCPISQPQDIEVFWSRLLSSQADFYDLAAQIKNPNQHCGSGQLPYRFEIYNQSGELIKQVNGSTFILPNQSKYLVESRIALDCPIEQVGQIQLSFGEISWDKLKDYYSLPQLIVQQKEYFLLESNQPGFSQARAILLNKTDFDFDKIDIDFLLFDDQGRLLALNTTKVRTLLADEKRDLVATWFEELPGQVSSLEIEAETNVFNPDNYLSGGWSEFEKFQEY